MGYYSLDQDELRREKIARQVSRFAAALSRDASGHLQFSPTDRLIHDFEDYPSAYAYRIVDHDGRVISEANTNLAPPHVWEAVTAADNGSSTVTHDGRQILVGAQKVDIAGQPARVSFASAGDPSGLIMLVYFDELFVHVIVALLPFALCLLLVNLLTVRQSMRPLLEASRAARETGHGPRIRRLPTDGLPREVFDLVEAINGALGRLEAALDAERAFTAEAAHALRTPLAVLAARVDQAQDRLGDSSLTRDVAAISRLIEQMLSSAQAETLVVDPAMRVDVGALAREVIADMAPLAIASGRELAVDGAESLAVTGDADAIAHALRNLVDNALRFAPEGSEAVIKVEVPAGLSVRDRGQGISPKDRSLVFNRFWRSDAAELGQTGLGLAIVKRIADAHGARITIDTPEDGGTLITLNFSERR